MAELKKIFIDSGHSINDCGAVKYEVERKLNIKISNYTKEYLLANYECLVKMADESVDSLTVIARAANDWGADLVLSPHMNAGGGDGYESLVYSTATMELGRIFEKYVKAIGQNSRGTKIRSDLGLLRLTNAKAIICEGAFVDNKKDIEDWNDDAELKKLGEAYAKAAAEYLKLPKKNKTTTSSKPSTSSSKKKYSGVFPKLPSRGYFKLGDNSTQVKYLQKFLNWFGDYKLVADGSIGSKTISAIKKYQKAVKLNPDGLFGKESLEKAKNYKK